MLQRQIYTLGLRKNLTAVQAALESGCVVFVEPTCRNTRRLIWTKWRGSQTNGSAKRWSLKRGQRDLIPVLRRSVETTGGNAHTKLTADFLWRADKDYVHRCACWLEFNVLFHQKTIQKIHQKIHQKTTQKILQKTTQKIFLFYILSYQSKGWYFRNLNNYFRNYYQDVIYEWGFTYVPSLL